MELGRTWRKMRFTIPAHTFFGSGIEQDSWREHMWNTLGGSGILLVSRSDRVWMMRSLLGFWMVSVAVLFLWLLMSVGFVNFITVSLRFYWYQRDTDLFFSFGVVINPDKEIGRVTLISRYGAQKVRLFYTCFFFFNSRTIFSKKPPKSSPFPTLQSLRLISLSSSLMGNTFPYSSYIPLSAWFWPCVSLKKSNLGVSGIFVPSTSWLSLIPHHRCLLFLLLIPLSSLCISEIWAFRSTIAFPGISVQLNGQVIR